MQITDPAKIRKPGSWASVLYQDHCYGFVINRRGGFEAYDIDEHSLGVFPDERAALATIFKQAGVS
jgi:hypothetical protein